MRPPILIRSSSSRRAPALVCGAQILWNHTARLALAVMIAIARTTPSSVAFSFAPLYPKHASHDYKHKSSCIRYTSFSGGHRAVSNSANNIVAPAAAGEDDLTKNDLLMRLAEVRNYYQQRPEDGMSQANVCLLLLRTRLSNIQLNRCYAAESTITDAGNGVFASRDIERGELITLYPGDAVLIQDSTAGEDVAAPVGVMFGNHVNIGDRDTSGVTTHEARSYEMEINTYTSIVADPRIDIEGCAYMGHVCNDGAALHEFDKVSREIYTAATAESCNAEHIVMEGAHMGTIATRAIKNGEEIFVSYGEGYWLSRSDPSLIAKTTGVVVEVPGAEAQGNIPDTASSTESRADRRKKKKNKKLPKDKQGKRGFGT
mmetsp:Transcript_37642/g.67802  ORF Transcript_37642/g.67802 Transcript_37642/m.67802 type:complete len:373 (-) Transcript_37642:106-1224(-)|eukprot:CAMPEP_0201900904 /NCGR_PEP_ID=MMETSP0902-20130614/53286_1 /ASSEMBLY_ACC=CAM_ASM_000551 /TAXON_ID=420261 /ORGANISM="Thalassiosira antarctica, Strain CCMP982" /LENGTH=372 /DNA_ID=CAMNT_0048434705 /DNA_START=52 /DNA_END=1170 /DNA_ORIENTATION=-